VDPLTNQPLSQIKVHGAKMFCPLCKTEYREGFYMCADCSVPLVAELPQIEETEPQLLEDETSSEDFEGKIQYKGDFVDVFETLDQTEILIVKSVLDDERIPYHFSGDFFRMSGILISPARLFVPSELKGRVLEILKEELQMIA
jgi:hypothetical protein